MAAETLVNAGVKVTMLDVGVQEGKYKSLIPDMDFDSIRRGEPDQHRFFLGDDFEAVPWGDVKTGAQLTPPRKFMIDLVDKFLPIASKSFSPMESLALGGLGSGWGIGCNVFSQRELEACGLDQAKMKDAYRVVSERIGISGQRDDATPYTSGDLDNLLPISDIDDTCSTLLGKYKRKRDALHTEGFFMGRPALALLTQDRNERKAASYNDMAFYSDKEQSAYRPWITIESLRKASNFEYISSRLVVSFSENDSGVVVNCIDTRTNEKQSFACKTLVLASGVLGTARIVLRSFPNLSRRLSLLCNPYTYLPCLQPELMGTKSTPHRTGFAQLAFLHDREKVNFDVSQASIYSYSSLLLFRLVKETPLGLSDGRKIMQYILPGFTIAGIQHPDTSSDNKYLMLEQDGASPTGDKLRAEYSLTETEQAKIEDREKKFKWAFRKLRCFPIKKVNPGFGSSIHYAGALPFSDEERPFTLSRSGSLHGSRNVFVADGSGFKYLPAKGLTFSLMANAHNVANAVLNNG